MLIDQMIDCRDNSFNQDFKLQSMMKHGNDGIERRSLYPGIYVTPWIQQHFDRANCKDLASLDLYITFIGM